MSYGDDNKHSPISHHAKELLKVDGSTVIVINLKLIYEIWPFDFAFLILSILSM